MSENDIVHFTSQAMLLVLLLSMPAIAVVTAVGLAVGVVQALTQVQEQTMQFAVKLVAVVITLVLTARWLGLELRSFAQEMFDQIPFVVS